MLSFGDTLADLSAEPISIVKITDSAAFLEDWLPSPANASRPQYAAAVDFKPEPWTETDPYIVQKMANFGLDQTIQFEVFVTLTNDDPVEGWSLSLQGGPTCTVVGATAEGTDAGDPRTPVRHRPRLRPGSRPGRARLVGGLINTGDFS